MRLESSVQDARYYQPDPAQRTQLDRILNQLIDVSLLETGKSFHDRYQPFQTLYFRYKLEILSAHFPAILTPVKHLSEQRQRHGLDVSM